MTVTITNLSDHLVSIRLNTGQTRHIPPRASLTDLLQVEIQDNAIVEKLERRRIIKRSGFLSGPKSRDMTAADAIEHIQNTPLRDLQGFISDNEDRVTVLQAFQEKQQG